MSGEFPDVAETVTQIQFVNMLLFFFWKKRTNKTKTKQNSCNEFLSRISIFLEHLSSMHHQGQICSFFFNQTFGFTIDILITTRKMYINFIFPKSKSFLLSNNQCRKYKYPATDGTGEAVILNTQIIHTIIFGLVY